MFTKTKTFLIWDNCQMLLLIKWPHRNIEKNKNIMENCYMEYSYEFCLNTIILAITCI